MVRQIREPARKPAPPAADPHRFLENRRRAAGVEFDPFAGPSLLHTAPSTESQREIWTACRMGDDASLAEVVRTLERGAGRQTAAA